MVNAVKLVLQVALVGSRIVTKALLDAYRQAAQQSLKSGSTTTAKASTVNRSNYTMTVQEAYQILNVSKTDPAEKVTKNFEYLFKSNDKGNGGSFYLQSKIYRAKERIDAELLKSTQSGKST